MKPLIFILIVSASLYGCYYDSEEYLFPDTGSNCDTTNVTYSGSVAAILDNNCLVCHNNASAAALGGNVRIEDYADVKIIAENGKLLGTINHSSGFVTMPQGADKLDACTISVVRIWIEAGAMNN
jgi:hypothetical protein